MLLLSLLYYKRQTNSHKTKPEGHYIHEEDYFYVMNLNLDTVRYTSKYHILKEKLEVIIILLIYLRRYTCIKTSLKETKQKKVTIF